MISHHIPYLQNLGFHGRLGRQTNNIFTTTVGWNTNFALPLHPSTRPKSWIQNMLPVQHMVYQKEMSRSQWDSNMKSQNPRALIQYKDVILSV